MIRNVLELGARWYVFVFLNLYGIGKIVGGQFYRRGELPPDVANTPLGEAAAFDLAWTFMGFSFAYILFIGLAEIIGAWMLLWDRTKLLGVLVLLPIMTNIIVFDVIFLDAYGALASATIYTLLLLFILYCNRHKVARACKALMSSSQIGTLAAEHSHAKKTAKWAMAIGAMAILFLVDQILVNLLGHGAG